MTATLLRKISPATIYNDLPRLDIPGAPEQFPLYSVYGIASKIRTGSTDKGDWVSFKGQFEAMTPAGELFVSGQVFLPQPFEDMLYSQLQAAQQTDEKASVQFAVRVYLVAPKKGKPSATGYEYRCEPLIESAETSPILALRAEVMKKVELLPNKGGEPNGTQVTKVGDSVAQSAGGSRRR